MASTVGLIEALVAMIRNDTGEAKAQACGALGNLLMDEERNLDRILSSGILVDIASILKATDVTEWSRGEDVGDNVQHKGENENAIAKKCQFILIPFRYSFEFSDQYFVLGRRQETYIIIGYYTHSRQHSFVSTQLQLQSSSDNIFFGYQLC